MTSLHLQLTVLAVLHAALLGAAAAGRPLVACLVVVLVLAAEAWGSARVPSASAALARVQLHAEARWFIRFLLVVTGFALAPSTAAITTWALICLGTAVLLARGAWLGIVRRGRRWQRQQVRWQGFAVEGALSGPDPVREPRFLRTGPTSADGVLAVEWFLVVGIGFSAPLDSSWPVWSALGLTMAAILLFLGRAMQFERQGARCMRSHLQEDVVRGLGELSPEVVVYFSSSPSGTYALGVWLDVIRRLRNRVVVVLREAHHMESLNLTGVPTVVLPSAQDVEQTRVDSMKVVLYPTNVVKNNHMVRLPGLRHAFIGHGDSDKAGSFSPITRVYDEIWVAGDAGRDRYLAAGEGVRPEQIRQVSRPQLAELMLPAEPRDGLLARPTVLYAPTWEGFYDESDYCSLVAPGLEAVRSLVVSGRVRVLFKPHPASGERRPEVADAAAHIDELLLDGPHERLPDEPGALYRAMREADVLLSDVSSLLSDWLATGKPYVVANPKSFPVGELHERFPTTRGGDVLNPGGDLPAVVDEALVADHLSATRAELTRYLLGPRTSDPVQDFVDEVAAFVERAPAVTARAGTVDTRSAP